MNIEEEKMREIIDYFSEHFPGPYTIEAVPIRRLQSTIHDDRKLHVLRDRKVAFTVIVSSALLSDVNPSAEKLAELLKVKTIADKLNRSAEFRLNHYELGTDASIS
ncbi:MAG: hypothetical protein K0S58_1035 [Nitrospira sp.]|jgi:hypothetical protein|nr:hypothetical protein [Nitrospira sp.]